MKRTWIVLTVGFWIAAFACCAGANDSIERHGKYIRLTTDLASATECDDLVATFDAAVPQWLEFWNLSENDVADWKVHAWVMRDKRRFANQGLIPERLPDFPFGYTLGNQIWVLVQPSEYYTRHLLLHEGAHSLAFHQFHGAGPTWFMEGTAEMLATHSGVGPQVSINQIPRTRDGFPYWGRFKLIGQLRGENKVPSLETVMRYQPTLLGSVDTYGWSWAATMLLHAYPEYKEAFLSSARNGRDTSSAFNRRLFLLLRSQWPVLNARWRLMCQELAYGFDWDIERVQLSEHDPVWEGNPIDVEVAAKAGWQSIGVRIPPATKVRLSATGTVVLAQEPKPWTSQPEGITFQYHAGRPLGQLLVCVLPNAVNQATLLPKLDVRAVEGEATIEINEFSWLLLRVNDSLGDRGDNTGSYLVKTSR